MTVIPETSGVHHMLSVSQDIPFLIAPSVFSNVYLISMILSY